MDKTSNKKVPFNGWRTPNKSIFPNADKIKKTILLHRVMDLANNGSSLEDSVFAEAMKALDSLNTITGSDISNKRYTNI